MVIRSMCFIVGQLTKLLNVDALTSYVRLMSLELTVIYSATDTGLSESNRTLGL
jgi:hypothetical protein